MTSKKLTKYFSVKQNKSMFDFMFMHPVLMYIFSDVNWYCYLKGLPVVITRVIDKKIPGVSTSTTHEDARAFDMSLRGWSDQDIKEFIKHFNNKYSDEFGAFSKSDGKARLIPPIDHAGFPHFHFQIRPGL